MASATTGPAVPPDAPTLAAAAPTGDGAKTASEVILTITAPTVNGGASVTGYQIRRSLNQIAWEVIEANFDSDDDLAADNIQYEDKGLTAGTTYYYEVRAINSAGVGSAATGMLATTGTTALGAPTGLVAVAESSSRVELYWITPGDPDGDPITGYWIEVSEDSGTTWTNVASDTGSRSTTHTHMGAPAGKALVYRVSAINSGGGGVASVNEMVMTPEASVPGMPMSVSAMATSDTEITVSWMAPADMGASAITGYMVQRAYMMSDGTMSAWMNTACTGTAMMCMDTGLMPETKYYYRVRAMNAEGYGEYSDGMATATTEATPAELMAPMNIRVNPVGSGLVNVGWDGVSGAAGYTIVAVNTADPTQVMTESVNNPNAVAGQIGNLMVGGVYNIYVGSFDANLDFAVDLSLRKRVTVE